MGKGCDGFQEYLFWASRHPGDLSRRGSVFHTPTGAIFAYERWYGSGKSLEAMTAQMLSLAIRGHHGGLPDCVDATMHSPYLDSLHQDKGKLQYQAAVSYFLAEISSEAQLDALFIEACREVAQLHHVERAQWPFTQGMLTRVLLSIVVDADRWDTACFEKNEDVFREEERTDWGDLSQRLEHRLMGYSRDTRIGEIRGKLSDACAEGSACPPGIYTLTVPTGGGKTLASLRYALNHAVRTGNRSRIFYVIPFNTILDQNSDELRRALNGYPGILEHYGVFTSEQEGEDGEREEQEHLLLTERWDTPDYHDLHGAVPRYALPCGKHMRPQATPFSRRRIGPLMRYRRCRNAAGRFLRRLCSSLSRCSAARCCCARRRSRSCAYRLCRFYRRQ